MPSGSILITSCRGAGSSKGRTSWTGKPELDDYISFAGFMIHYLHHLKSPDQHKGELTGNATSSPLTTIPSSVPAPIVHTSSKTSTLGPSPSLLLGGYSYGSIIAKHLPPTSDIIMSFQTAIEGSAEGEIKMRARSMARQMSEQWEEERRPAQRTRQKPRNRSDTLQAPPVTMGGEETPVEVRRSSREIRRSMDRPRSVDIPRKLLRRVSGQKHSLEKEGSHAECGEDCEISPPSTCYLLVSPLLPPVSTSLAISLGQTFWKASDHSTAENISRHPTLAVTGGEDMFTASKSLRKWSQKYGATGDFTFEEVKEAGHFWREPGVDEKLLAILRAWLQSLPG